MVDYFYFSYSIFSAQALIAPFPSIDSTLFDVNKNDEVFQRLEEHLLHRIDERHRLNMVNIS